MEKLKKPFLFFLTLLLMIGLVGFTTHVFADDEDTEIQTSTEVETTDTAEVQTIANQDEIVAFYDEQMRDIADNVQPEIFEACEETNNEQSTEQDETSTIDTSSENSGGNPENTEDSETIQEETRGENVNTSANEDADSSTPDTDISDMRADTPEGLTPRQYADDTNRKLVAMIDTGSNLAEQAINFTDDDDNDIGTHGNDVATSILDGNTDNAYLISIKALSFTGKGSMANVMKGLKYAIDTDVDIINMSFIASADNNTEEFSQLVQEAIDKGIKIVAAAGNQNSDAINYIPANMPGVITVGARNESNIKLKSSNYGDCVDYYMCADSTSLAAAKLTAKLIAGQSLDEEITNDKIIIETPENAPEHTDEFQAQATLYDFIYSKENNGTLFMHCANGENTGNTGSGTWYRAGRPFYAAYLGLGWWNPGQTYTYSVSNLRFSFVAVPQITFDANGGSGGKKTINLEGSNVDWSFNSSSSTSSFSYYSPNNAGENGKWINAGSFSAGSRSGYTFAGWNRGGLNNNARIASNYTFKAQWNPNYYKLTITGDEGVESITGSGSYPSGTTANATYIIKPGYHLKNISGTTYEGGTNTWTDKEGKEGTVADSWSIGACNRTVKITTEPNTYTNSIAHWLRGFENAEGNNGNGDAYYLDTTNFTKTYGEEFVMDASRATVIPNGCYINQDETAEFSKDGKSWTDNIFGAKKQKAYDMHFQYGYRPITYNITYNLNGGTLEKANPSTYNVLYGVNFTNEPTKKGYSFLGWYIGNQKVTGINVGANATFASVDDLYAKLKTRTTGNQTVTAKWEKLPELKVNVAVSGNMGRRDKEFSFTTQFPSSLYNKNLTVEKSDGTTGTIAINDSGVASFTLKHGESIAFKDLTAEQANAVKALPDLGIKEQDYSSEGYSTVYSVSSEPDGTLAVSYRNTKRSAVPTGNHIGTGITAVVVIGIVGLVIMLRKKRK